MRYLNEDAADTLYRAMLDEVFGSLNIAGLKISTSRALRELDPIAYRCGFNDWCDAEGITTSEDEADEDEEADLGD